MNGGGALPSREARAVVKTERRVPPVPLGSPPAVWASFVAQGRWKSWTLVTLLGLLALQSLAVIRLATRPPEVVLVDAGGDATPVRRTVATDALLKFLADRTRPPDVAVVRFTRDFLRLALGLNSTTIDANWPAALAMMAPELRARIEAEASRSRLLETWRLAQRRIDLGFDEVVLEDRNPGALTIRATLTRRTMPLVEGAGTTSTDRVRVELVARSVTPTLDRPDGLEVAEWRLSPIPVRENEFRPDMHGKGVTNAP
jgi:hypothetical protein